MRKQPKIPRITCEEFRAAKDRLDECDRAEQAILVAHFKGCFACQEWLAQGNVLERMIDEGARPEDIQKQALGGETILGDQL